MFFVLSKLIWFIVAPSHILLWLSVGASLALLAGYQKTGRYLAILSSALFIIIGVLPTFVWLARPIEFQYSRPSHLPLQVDGILVLGGGSDDRFRLSAAYALARHYPGARFVFSGGSSALLDNQPGVDAKKAASFVVSLGLAPERLTLEGRSRSTWENFLFTKQLIKPQTSQTWVLATSALQMPRAMETAQRLGWNFLPWPTDWISGRDVVPPYFRIADNLGGFDAATHEWIGLLAYRLSGKALATAGNNRETNNE